MIKAHSIGMIRSTKGPLSVQGVNAFISCKFVRLTVKRRHLDSQGSVCTLSGATNGTWNNSDAFKPVVCTFEWFVEFPVICSSYWVVLDLLVKYFPLILVFEHLRMLSTCDLTFTIQPMLLINDICKTSYVSDRCTQDPVTTTGKKWFFPNHQWFFNLPISFHRLSIKDNRCCLYQ